MIEAVCVCGEKRRVPEEQAGLSIECPKCRRLIAVPGTRKVAETIPPPGLKIDPGPTDSPGVAPPDASGPGRSGGDDPLVGAVERLVGIGRGIQVLLAGI